MSLGNGALTYPIGIINADEVLMAGLINGQSNLINYLYTNQGFWSLSPFFTQLIIDESAASMLSISTSGALSNDGVMNGSVGVRPVVSINSQTEVTSNGSSENPFKVV